MSKIYQKPYPAGKNAGFTLIELLVVVLIIGILAAVALPKYQLAVAKSRAAAFMPPIRSVADANTRYYMANGEYATDFTQLDIDLPPGGTLSSSQNIMTYDNRKIFLCGEACSYSVQGTPDLNISFYIEYYTSGGIVCWAHNSSDLANQVCHSLSGANFTSTSDTGYNSYFVGRYQ